MWSNPMDRQDATHPDERLVHIPAGEVILDGNLAIPSGARAVVLFAHGSGSSRHSPRNRFVAQVLQAAGLATLLTDLLTLEEERADAATGHLRFDIELLAARVVIASEWLASAQEAHDLRLGYFGASTGAGAALVAAARLPDLVHAIVSRGGRPDLAGDALPQVQAPTLLLVGGRDVAVIAMNRDAMARMRAHVELEIIPGATHLFEEPGALEAVAARSGRWLLTHVLPPAGPTDQTASRTHV
jgi:dienelactone hydrolase